MYYLYQEPESLKKIREEVFYQATALASETVPLLEIVGEAMDRSGNAFLFHKVLAIKEAGPHE